MKKLTLDVYEKEALRISGTKNIGESEQIMVLLLASLQEGVNIDALAKFTRYPKSIVTKTVQWLKESGTYRNGKFAVAWFEKDGGGLALLCDVLCVQGLLDRA